MSKLLIVEDEPTISIALQDDLEIEGYEVEAVSDGETAEQKARQGGYDLILLDVMLPGKDGFSVCRSLRRDGIATPIILLTARARESEKIAGLDLGADDYITKPFSPAELVARIRAVLRRRGPTGAPKQQFGDVSVDFERHEVHKGGRLAELTPSEFDLLRIFLENRGKVLSIDELLKRVRGPDVFLTDRVIYAHLNTLRNKIEDLPSKPKYLISVRGVGYRFDG